MKGHEEIERILASYRDASAEERARADAHVATCPACAARLAAFGDVDARMAALAQPPLPPRLARPLSVVIAPRDSSTATQAATGFVFTRTFVPAAIVLIVILALSVLMWSLDSGRTLVTATPTLTTTLTPTLISARQTEPAAAARFALSTGIAARPVPPRAAASGVTPAPAPAPAAGNAQVFLAGFRAHATMTH